MTRFILTAFICFNIFSSKAQVLVPQPVYPESSGMSSERLKILDTLVQGYINRHWYADAVAIIVHNGKVVYYKGFGYDDIDKRTPMPKDKIFRIASQTKAIVSTAVMMLYEEGKFLLDDPVSKFIPEFSNPKVLSNFNDKDSSYTTVAAKREITIRDLLTHTAGLDYPAIGSPSMRAIYAKADIPSGLGTQDKILAEEMRKLAKLPLAHQPGEKWTYGLNVDLLGYLIEVLSGKTLNDFLRTRIFEPMGMTDTYFYLPASKQSRLAVLYMEDSTKHVIKSPAVISNIPSDYPNSKSQYYSGGAGLSSTAFDYAQFLQMMLNGGIYNGKRILSRNSVRMMTQNQIGDINFGDDKFGLGFGIVTEKGSGKYPTQAGSFSWGGYFGTSYWADPKEKIIGLFMTQMASGTHGDIHDKFKVLVYSALNN